jgi:LPS-assembly protein
MRFSFNPVLALAFLLFSLPVLAAETVLPASAVSPSASAPDKTVYIEAQEVEGKKDSQMEAKGSVELQQGNQKVFADHLIYEQTTGELTANGAVRLEQPTGAVSGPDLKMNTFSHIGEMTTPVFELKQDNQSNARGSALIMRTTGPTYYEFDHATYTTCPAGEDDWLLHMSRLDIDRQAQIGTAHNAWVEFEGVPLLYTPWMTFPLDGQRHSGFLGPIYGNTASGGTEFTIPYYWNIAPNFDYTIAPRFMDKRGALLNNEFRFKEANSYGEFHYDTLQNDRISNSTRYHTSFKESQNLGNGFGATLNLNRVSDNAYFQDLSTTIQDATQTQLLNEGVLSYGAGWWSASVRAQTFQTLQDALGDVAIPYQRMPQVNLSAQKTFNDATVSLVDEYVDFRHPTLVEGQRLVIYPSVTYSLLNDPGYYLKPKLGVHYTDFEMGDNNSTAIPNSSRTLPIFSLDSGMTFERDMKLGAGEYVQTLEPRVYYVRIPYQNQDYLPLYDTSQATLSFAQIFTENRFYGSDRIGDADMATVGVTSRLIDNAGGVERLRVGVAERFSFTAPKVNLVAPDVNGRSDILLSVGGKITNALSMDSLLDYDPNAQATQSSSVTFAYKPEKGKLLNLGYRFSKDPTNSGNDVRQDDFSGQWPLFWHWYAVTRLSYSVQDHLLTQRLLGLEYNQSCWMLRLVAQKFWTSPTQSSSGVFIQLELNDLVALGSDPLSALRSSIPGYTKLNTTPASSPVKSTP